MKTYITLGLIVVFAYLTADREGFILVLSVMAIVFGLSQLKRQ